MKSDNSWPVQELTTILFDAKLKTRLHFGAKEIRSQPHVVLCVVLADGITYVVDPAGAQHGQHKPVLPMPDYHRQYAADFPSCSVPHGTAASTTKACIQYSPHLMDVENYQIDELHEWASKNVALKHLLKVKPTEYEQLKKVTCCPPCRYCTRSRQSHERRYNIPSEDLTPEIPDQS